MGHKLTILLIAFGVLGLWSFSLEGAQAEIPESLRAEISIQVEHGLESLRRQSEAGLLSQRAFQAHDDYRKFQKELPYVPAANFEKELHETKILKHYRSNSGIALVPEQFPTELGPQAKALVHRLRAHLSAAMRNDLEQLKNAPPLPTCEAKIKRKAARATKSSATPEVLGDLLIINGAQPHDADELFGAKVRVIACTEKGVNRCAPILPRYGLDCLPYRLRVTSKEVTEMYGPPALKNLEVK